MTTKMKQIRLAGWLNRLLMPLLLAVILVISNTAFAEKPGCKPASQISQERPNVEQGATEVQTALYILDIGEIDNYKQEFVADVVIELRWHDPRLASAAGGCRYGLDNIWHPSVQLFNQRGMRESLQKQVDVGTQGEVSYIQRYYGTFSSPLDLRLFPFDKQLLNIVQVSFYQSKDVKLVFNEKLTGMDKNSSISGWYIGKGSAALSEYSTQSDHAVQQVEKFSRLQYSVQVSRDVNYYRWKVLLPLALIVVMSWSVFWLNPSQVGPQMGAAATSMLTLIAFMFSLRGILPSISYLTHMDYFVYGSLALVFLTSLEAIVTCNLAQANKLVLARRIDLWARVIFPGVFVLLVVYYWL